ncbi:MAG: riboflavin kinase/FMN adenylyltransferase [Candidatus Azotimanducaceae bacterium]|jgi:riboflavin kinase/FMN adenylyltransferase
MEISGVVIQGDGYGKKLGYPTANIDRDQYVHEKIDLEYGIYAGLVTVHSSQEEYVAGIVIGPDDAQKLPKLEAHLIGYAGNLYGEMVTFRISKYLRPFKEYRTEDDLKADIKADLNNIMSLDVCSPES